MKEVIQGKPVSPRMLCVLFALLTLFTHLAHAQEKQAFPQGNSSAPAQCADNQLSLRYEDEVIGMRAIRFMKFIFINSSSSPCTLNGYPRFEFLNKSGHPAHGGLAANGVTLLGGYTEPPQLVTIQPGKTATFWVDYLARDDVYREKSCPTYRKFRVIAPGTKRVFVRRVGYVIVVCSRLEVSPVLTPPYAER